MRGSYKRDALYSVFVTVMLSLPSFLPPLPLPFPSANYRIVSTDDDDDERPGFGLSD